MKGIRLELSNTGGFAAFVPHVDGTESSFVLPRDPAKALQACHRILSAQANQSTPHKGLTASRSAPTQWDVDREAASSTRFCPECQGVALRYAGLPPDAGCPKCDGLGRVPSVTLCKPGRGLTRRDLSLDDLDFDGPLETLA